MNNKVVVGVGILIIVLISGAYMLTRPNLNNQELPETATSTDQTTTSYYMMTEIAQHDRPASRR